jgi:multiple sugar transport system ATP-binding protein
MAEVVLEGVSKRFPNGVEAVRDLNLTVADGELVVLVGPSGCGKTTILRLLAGLEDLTAGTIRISGQDVTRLPPRWRDVALAFQRPALYPHLTVGANLGFGLRLRQGWSWLSGEHSRVLAQRTADTADLLGLTDVLDRYPGQLSGGQQQRVALGRALVRNPAVFLLDEPLSNLDAPLRDELRRELHLLQRRLRVTMIYVTHDQVEALTLGDRVVVLRAGQAQQIDNPLVLYQRPCNRFVAGFLGWPRMNFLDGQLSRFEEVWSLADGSNELPLPTTVGAAWQSHRGREVSLGIRPQHLSLGAGHTHSRGTDGQSVLPAEAVARLLMEVKLVESLGESRLLTLQRQGWQVVAQVNGPPHTTAGQRVEVLFDLTSSYLFDRSTGQVLCEPPAVAGGLGGADG